MCYFCVNMFLCVGDLVSLDYFPDKGTREKHRFAAPLFTGWLWAMGHNCKTCHCLWVSHTAYDMVVHPLIKNLKGSLGKCTGG